MKSTEEYLTEYTQKKSDLEARDELWRLRVTEEEFLAEIERLRKYEQEARAYITNEYRLQQHIESQISIMLMENSTFEEASEQFRRLKLAAEKGFAEDAPRIRASLPFIQSPLNKRDAANIYRWIFRKQITLDMLPENIKDEFVKTGYYETLKERSVL